MADAEYIELTFDVPFAEAELVAYQLTESGVGGVEVRDESTLQKAERGTVTLVVWVQPHELDQFLGEASPLQTHLRADRPLRNEGQWRDVWKKYFTAQQIGRFVIVPSWQAYAARDGEVVLDLDPGRAFGTGTHPSTRLCLGVASEIGSATRVLDVGCGSGVLAIACAKRFADCTGVGIDIDPDAIEVSRENAERNHVLDRLTFATTPVGEITGAFDLVFANIQPDVLIPLRDQMLARLAPTGTLALSGIIDEAAADVIAAYRAADLTLTGETHEAGWTALTFVRR